VPTGRRGRTSELRSEAGNMNDYTVRILRSDEHRTAGELFGGSLHRTPAEIDQWNRAEGVVQPGRVFGAFDDELIGTVRSIDTSLVVPGGRTVTNAAVTGVGVRSDHTRRGVLRELMHAQLADCAARGVVTANLHASEGGIYERFGYGPATYGCHYRVDRYRNRLRDDLPESGAVTRISMAEAQARFPEIYASLPADRPGLLGRSRFTWAALWHWLSRADARIVTVVHHGTSGVDGFAAYEVRRQDNSTELTVHDMHFGTAEAFVGLWRYLCGVDLVDEIVLPNRPLDEPASLLFADPRGCRDTGGGDETWLRIVDVPAALRAATRGNTRPVVLAVHDDLLSGNTGNFRVTPDGVVNTEQPAQLRMDVATLGMVYLGAWRPSTLAALGRVTHTGPEALEQADRVFTGDRHAWCGTHF